MNRTYLHFFTIGIHVGNQSLGVPIVKNPLGNVYKYKESSCIVLLQKDRGVFLKRADILPQTPRHFLKTP